MKYALVDPARHVIRWGTVHSTLKFLRSILKAAHEAPGTTPLEVSH